MAQKDDQGGLVGLELEVLIHGRLLTGLGGGLHLLGGRRLPRLQFLSQRHFRADTLGPRQTDERVTVGKASLSEGQLSS